MKDRHCGYLSNIIISVCIWWIVKLIVGLFLTYIGKSVLLKVEDLHVSLLQEAIMFWCEFKNLLLLVGRRADRIVATFRSTTADFCSESIRSTRLWRRWWAGRNLIANVRGLSIFEFKTVLSIECFCWRFNSRLFWPIRFNHFMINFDTWSYLTLMFSFTWRLFLIQWIIGDWLNL